jgi:hypothetical protein
MSDLPADGLDARTLLRAMRRLAWILSDAAEEISRLPGKAPSSVFVDRFPVRRSMVAGPEGIADQPSG